MCVRYTRNHQRSISFSLCGGLDTEGDCSLIDHPSYSHKSCPQCLMPDATITLASFHFPGLPQLCHCLQLSLNATLFGFTCTTPSWRVLLLFGRDAGISDPCYSQWGREPSGAQQSALSSPFLTAQTETKLKRPWSAAPYPWALCECATFCFAPPPLLYFIFLQSRGLNLGPSQ